MGRKHNITLSRAANLRQGLKSAKQQRVELLDGDGKENVVCDSFVLVDSSIYKYGNRSLIHQSSY
jgi:hypothetical protein